MKLSLVELSLLEASIVDVLNSGSDDSGFNDLVFDDPSTKLALAISMVRLSLITFRHRVRAHGEDLRHEVAKHPRSLDELIAVLVDDVHFVALARFLLFCLFLLPVSLRISSVYLPHRALSTCILTIPFELSFALRFFSFAFRALSCWMP